MAWQMMAAQAAGNLVSSIAGGDQSKKAYKYQKQLMQDQAGYNEGLMNKSYEQQKQMYDYTYDKEKAATQVANLKEAGLNPALMYGGGANGAGGMTGSGGASVSGGSASGAAEMTNAQTNKSAMLMQSAMTASQIKLNEATAEKTQAEAAKISGVDTELTKSTTDKNMTDINKAIEETENTKELRGLISIQKALGEIDVTESDMSREARMQGIANQTSVIAETMGKLIRENNISDETREAIINETNARAIGAILDNEAKKANINLTKEQTRAIGEQLAQGWGQLDNAQKQTRINEFKERIKAQYPSLMQAGGKWIDQVTGFIWSNADKLMGGEGKNYHPTEVMYPKK